MRISTRDEAAMAETAKTDDRRSAVRSVPADMAGEFERQMAELLEQVSPTWWTANPNSKGIATAGAGDRDGSAGCLMITSTPGSRGYDKTPQAALRQIAGAMCAFSICPTHRACRRYCRSHRQTISADNNIRREGLTPIIACQAALAAIIKVLAEVLVRVLGKYSAGLPWELSD